MKLSFPLTKLFLRRIAEIEKRQLSHLTKTYTVGVYAALFCFGSAVAIACIHQVVSQSVQAEEIDKSIQQDEKSITAKCDAADLIVVGKLRGEFLGRASTFYGEDIEVLYGKIAPGRKLAVALRAHLLLRKPDKDAKWICFLKPVMPKWEGQIKHPELEWRCVIGDDDFDYNGIVVATPENLALVKKWISKKQSGEAGNKTAK